LRGLLHLLLHFLSFFGLFRFLSRLLLHLSLLDILDLLDLLGLLRFIVFLELLHLLLDFKLGLSYRFLLLLLLLEVLLLALFSFESRLLFVFLSNKSLFRLFFFLFEHLLLKVLGLIVELVNEIECLLFVRLFRVSIHYFASSVNHLEGLLLVAVLLRELAVEVNFSDTVLVF